MLFNTATTVLADSIIPSTAKQLERLLITPLLDSAESADANHVISVDLAFLEVSFGEDDSDNLLSCSITQQQQNRTQNRTETDYESSTGYDLSTSEISRDSIFSLVGLFTSSALIYWSQKAHKTFWETQRCSFRFEADKSCFLSLIVSSLVSSIGFGGLGGFGTGMWNDWTEKIDRDKRREAAERMKRVEDHYEILEQIASLLDSQGRVLVGSTGFHGHVMERGSGLVSGLVRRSSITWKDGNETRVELFEPGAALAGVIEMLKGRGEAGGGVDIT